MVSAARRAAAVEKLTLVVDEAVGGEQFEGVDLEQDPVEQEVVSRGTELGFVAQTGLGELLRKATGAVRFQPRTKVVTWGERHGCNVGQFVFMLPPVCVHGTHSHERVFKRLTCINDGLLGHSSISVGLDLQYGHLEVQIVR